MVSIPSKTTSEESVTFVSNTYACERERFETIFAPKNLPVEGSSHDSFFALQLQAAGSNDACMGQNLICDQKYSLTDRLQKHDDGEIRTHALIEQWISNPSP